MSTCMLVGIEPVRNLFVAKCSCSWRSIGRHTEAAAREAHGHHADDHTWWKNMLGISQASSR